MEVSSICLSVSNLGKEIDDLTRVASGTYSVVYTSAETSVDQCNPSVLKENLVVMIDEFYVVKTWTGLRGISIAN